jgi:hypothetical protein
MVDFWRADGQRPSRSWNDLVALTFEMVNPFLLLVQPASSTNIQEEQLFHRALRAQSEVMNDKVPCLHPASP